jgi:anti-sigma regulatory factor (Ser/Thr protein kinase)
VSESGFTHSALFYRSEDAYLDGAIPFVEEGLAAGEPVQVAVPPAKLRLLWAALDGFREWVHWTDMAEAGRNPTLILHAELSFADTHPERPVRVLGEPAWPGRSALELQACAVHEALVNRAFAGRPVTALCPYDVRGLEERTLADARATHPFHLDGGERRHSTDYAPDRVLADHHEQLPALPERAATLTVDDPHALTDARRFAATQADHFGLPDERVIDLETAVTELVSNAIVHGGGEGSLRLWTEDEQVVCEVRDTGRFTDVLAGRLPVDAERTNGRGLLLVNHLSDLLSIYAGPAGTAVRVHLSLG